MEEDKTGFKILTGKPKGKGFLGEPRHRWENIILDFKIVISTRNWFLSAQDRNYSIALLNAALNIHVSKAMGSVCRLFRIMYTLCDTYSIKVRFYLLTNRILQLSIFYRYPDRT